MIGKTLLGFLVLMVVGYLTVVVFLPPPNLSTWRPDDMTGQSAAARLSAEARLLAGHHVSSGLQ